MTLTKKELKKLLKDILKEKEGVEDLSFEYRSAQTSFHTRLKIVVSADTIVHERIPKDVPVDEEAESKAAEVHTMEFSKEQLLTFLKELSALKIWDLANCTERALPDMAIPTFTLKYRNDLVFEQNVWDLCRNDNPRTNQVLKAIEYIIPYEWTPP